MFYRNFLLSLYIYRTCSYCLLLANKRVRNSPTECDYYVQ